MTKIHQLTDLNNYQVGDYVDYSEDIYTCTPKIIVRITPEGAQLKDPFLQSYHIDNSIQPFSKLKPFRTWTKLKQPSTISYRKRVQLRQIQDITRVLEQIMAKIQTASAKELIQIIRGKIYFFALGLLTSQIQGDLTIGAISNFFKMARKLFLKYIVQVDFAQYKPADIYSSPMNALCSCYLEMFQILEISSGFYMKTTDCKINNQLLFRNEAHQKEIQEWIQCQLLPFFVQAKHSIFPIGFQVNLIVLAVSIFRKVNLQISEPLIQFFSVLYEEILGQITNIVTDHKRQIQLFIQNMSQIFKIMYAGASSNLQVVSLESSRTQKMDIEGENLKIESSDQKMEDQSIKVISNGSHELNENNVPHIKKQQLTQLEYIKTRQMQYRFHLCYAYLMKGSNDKAAEQLTICFNQLGKAEIGIDPKIKEEKMHFEQNWPTIAHHFFFLLEKKKILELMLSTPKMQQFSVVTRTVTQKMYNYVPKYTLISCISHSKFALVRNILNSKIIKEDICEWLFSYLVDLNVEEKNIRSFCEFLKSLADWMKNRQALPHYVENRKIILQKLFKIGSKAQKIDFSHYQHFFITPDNIKVEVFQKYCQKYILPHIDNLLVHFQECLLTKYCNNHQINLYEYQKLLSPMLIKNKDIEIYSKRQLSIVSVLHFIYNRNDRDKYFTYLKLFIKYYTHPDHDKNLVQNSWGKLDVQPQLSNNQVSLFTLVDQEFCSQVIPKLLPLWQILDIKLFNDLLVRYNFLKGIYESAFHKYEINQMSKVPYYFEECLQAFFYLNKQELKLHQQYINEYFLKANQEALNQMLKIFLQVILRNECVVKEANQSFKIFKTKYHHYLVSLPPKSSHLIPAKSSNLISHDYKVRFHNVLLQKKLEQFGKIYEQNEQRQLIIEEEKKSAASFDIKNNETITLIKYKLAHKINRQPSEIYLLNNKKEPISQLFQNKTLGQAMLEFIQQEEHQAAKNRSRTIPINIYFTYKHEKSSIHKSIMQHADELFNLMPKSWFIFQGIDLKVDNWADFDRFNKIADSFEKAISSDQIIAPNFKSNQLQSNLLDYFLWRKDQEDLKLYDFRALYSLSKKIDDIKSIFFNLKIAYLIFASGNFRLQDRQKLLNLLLFAEPKKLSSSSLDEQQAYIKLSQLVYKILQSNPEGVLEFCFTTNFVQKFQEAQITEENFNKFWEKSYQEASFKQKSKIFQNIEQRLIKFPQNMRQLGTIIQEESVCQFQEKIMYEEAIQRMIKFLLEIHKGNPLPPPVQMTQIILDNSINFLKKQLRHQIIESQQFLSFLIQHLYTYIMQLPQSIFILIFHSSFNPQNRRRIIQFINAQISQKQWIMKDLLDVPKKNHQMQTLGLVGLKNGRNICFANSLFQHLYHNQQFRQELLAVQWQKDIQPQDDLILQLKNIFLHLKESRVPHLNELFFDRAFKLFGNHIIPYTQIDVDEFRSELFNNLQGLLPKNIFWKKLFVGKQVSRITCLQCNNISNTEQTFDSIHLSVQEDTLQKSLHQYSKPTILQNQDAYSCQKCNKKVKAEKTVTIKDLPPNLVFVLKRFEYLPLKETRHKLFNYFQFPFDNLEYFPNHKYNLKGIISHLGNPQSGHYVSFIKLKKKWYEFNDADVRQISEQLVMNYTFGTSKLPEKSIQNERTAYLLFYEAVYEAVDESDKANKMQIENKIVGVEDEIQRLRKQRLLMQKQKTYFNKYYLQFIKNLCKEFPEQNTFRLLFKTLIEITFKMRLVEQNDIKDYTPEIESAIKLINLYPTSFSFIWEKYNLEKILDLLKSFIPFQYKAILGYLLVQNFSEKILLRQYFLQHCLTAIYSSRTDVSLFYYILYGIVKKFQWAQKFVVQHRLVGRILDIVFHGLVESQMRTQLKKTTQVPFQSGYKVQAANLKEGLRYYRWALLAYLVQSNYALLHERQQKYIKLQNHLIIRRYFQECKGKVQMRYLNQYLCFLSHHLQNDYTEKLLNSMRYSLINQKTDNLRKYLKLLKDLTAIEDEYKQKRIQDVVATFHHVLRHLNQNTGQNMEFIWLWLLKIANKNESFRAELSNRRVLFDYLANKSYSSTPIARYQRLNNFPKTRYLLHKIHIPQNYQQVMQHHQAKMQKTRALLSNCVYEKDLSEEDSDGDIANEFISNFPAKIYKFRDMTQDFEAIQVKFVIGDIFFVEAPIMRQRYPTSAVLYKGDQRLYLKNPLLTIDQDQSTPVRKRPREQAMSENNSVLSVH